MKGGWKCNGDPIHLRGYKIGKYYIGECVYQSSNFIYKVCMQNDDIEGLKNCDDIVAKVYQLDDNFIIDEKVEQEVNHLRYINTLNIAPIYYGLKIFTYNGSRYGLILMEHYGGNDLKNSGTLEELLKFYDIKQDEKI